jgi:hypothetical protein
MSRNKIINKQKATFIRFVNRDVLSIDAIDKIAIEFNCTRANAITKIIDRLNEVDRSYLNPLISAPKLISY